MLLNQLPSYYKSRRDQLMSRYAGAAFLLPAHPELIRNSDVHFPYRQDSSFYYLSGLSEADSFLVLAPSKTHSSGYKYILFVAPRDPEKEMWEGERYGVEGATKIFGADEAYSIHEFDKVFPELLQGCDRVFYRVGVDAEQDRKIFSKLDTLRRSLGRTGRSLPPIEDPMAPIGEMRLFKGREEVDLLRKACEITALAHKTAMQEVKPGMNECEIEALVDYIFRKNGCQRVGYSSIVAGGKNAACLHYRSNNENLNEGDLLLIDAGGEYGFYSSDITRTFPIGRRFTKAQAQAYDLVLKAQKEGIAMAKPGVTLPAIHQHTCNVLIDGLLSLGLLKGSPDEILKSGKYRRFYPHNTSHWLGMDVHDAGLYVQKNEPRPLQAGMVFTIEPGFYVQPSDQETPSEFHRIGIRIEDDILITENGCDVLTKDAPKERADLEALRS